MENDLQQVRDKTERQAEHYRAIVDNKVQNVEQLRQENEQLKNVINLYKNKLQKEAAKWTGVAKDTQITATIKRERYGQASQSYTGSSVYNNLSILPLSSNDNQVIQKDALEANSNILEIGNSGSTPLPLATIPQESSINQSKDDISIEDAKGGQNPFRKNQISQITEFTHQTI